MNFTLETAKSLLQEDKEFLVNFDYFIKWCNVNSKQQAINLLIQNFSVNIDYICQADSLSIANSIYLRLDSAKEFASMCKTEKGRLFKRTLIEAEKELGVFINKNLLPKNNAILKSYEERINYLEKVVQELRTDVNVVNQQINKVGYTVETDSNIIETDIINTVITLDNKIVEEDISTRHKIINLVSNYVKHNRTPFIKSVKGNKYEATWNLLYKTFLNETTINLKVKAKNNPSTLNGIAYAEKYRLIDLLYIVALELLI